MMGNVLMVVTKERYVGGDSKSLIYTFLANSTRLISRPITMSCIFSNFEKQIVFLASRLICKSVITQGNCRTNYQATLSYSIIFIQNNQRCSAAIIRDFAFFVRIAQVFIFSLTHIPLTPPGLISIS